jgi:PIN domain nuclease of toxin-antitoxin system
VAARNLICDAKTQKLVSIASAWEVAIKVSRGKLTIGGPFQGFFEQQMAHAYFEWLPITTRHLELIAGYHFIMPIHLTAS